MLEVEVYRFHSTEPTKKQTMTLESFKAMKKQEWYIYRAYQLGFNKTMLK